MKISDKIREKQAQGKPVFSFEFFPPKTDKGEAKLFKTIEELKPLNPDFISVTYGAGGSTRTKTIDWVDRIKNEIGIEAMAHFTCVGAGRKEIAQTLMELEKRGIENILALRGDPPKGETEFTPPSDGFAYANELVEFIKSEGRNFAIGVAGYPESHLDAPDLDADILNLKRKVQAGGEFVITQLFFDNTHYFDFVRKLNDSGDWDTPVIPGIMPLTAKNQVEKFAEMCGAYTPDDLKNSIENAASDEEAAEIGLEHAKNQCVELLKKGAPGIHFYTLNKSPATRDILAYVRNELGLTS